LENDGPLKPIKTKSRGGRKSLPNGLNRNNPQITVKKEKQGAAASWKSRKVCAIQVNKPTVPAAKPQAK